jgi:hypothetical protein
VNTPLWDPAGIVSGKTQDADENPGCLASWFIFLLFVALMISAIVDSV